MCSICDAAYLRSLREPRREPVQFWSESWVLLELKEGMLAHQPHPEAATVPFVLDPPPTVGFLDIDTLQLVVLPQ